jgi:RNA polymerase sigma factor (sigma-70 family)
MPTSRDRSGEDVERALCDRLLDLARKGERGPEFRAALDSVYDLVVRQVSSVFRSWKALPPGVLEARDVAHEVFLRLQNSPPSHDPRHNARVTLLSWIRRSAVNYLTDVGRRASCRTVRMGPKELDRLAGNRIGNASAGNDPGRESERALWESESLAAFLRHLRSEYPRGARYIDTMRTCPGATVAELARLMGVSIQNLYQIRRRTSNMAVKWRRGNPS